MRFDPPDSYWKKDVALFLGKRFSLAIKLLYPAAIILPVAASSIPPQYAAAVVGLVAIMAGTFGAGESLTNDINDGILVRVALTPLSPYRIVAEILLINAALDFIQLLPALAGVYLLHPAPPAWVLAATVAVFATLLTANAIGILLANFTSSPADVLLYATIVLFPLIYLSGFFRNQHPEGILEVLRQLVPFAYMNDALKEVFGLAGPTGPLEAALLPTLIGGIVAAAVCLTAPRLLSPRL
ncbi:MAG: ABC transporter permease [Rubrobacter sp.]|nr:ABC transporter permease [Rubrobacter sp.]